MGSGPVSVFTIVKIGCSHSAELLSSEVGNNGPACISHHLSVEARNRPVITSLRLPAVLTVLFKYASARQAARASY